MSASLRLSGRAGVLLAAGLFVGASTKAGLQAPDVKLLSFYEGVWRGKAFGGNIEERFTSPGGGIVLGTSRIIGPGDKLIHKEFMEMGMKDGALVYTVTLPGKTHTFSLARLTKNAVTWADPKNDFPAKITYSRSGNVMTVVLEGKPGAQPPQKVTFTMTRQ